MDEDRLAQRTFAWPQRVGQRPRDDDNRWQSIAKRVVVFIFLRQEIPALVELDAKRRHHTTRTQISDHVAYRRLFVARLPVHVACRIAVCQRQGVRHDHTIYPWHRPQRGQVGGLRAGLTGGGGILAQATASGPDQLVVGNAGRHPHAGEMAADDRQRVGDDGAGQRDLQRYQNHGSLVVLECGNDRMHGARPH